MDLGKREALTLIGLVLLPLAACDLRFDCFNPAGGECKDRLEIIWTVDGLSDTVYCDDWNIDRFQVQVYGPDGQLRTEASVPCKDGSWQQTWFIRSTSHGSHLAPGSAEAEEGTYEVRLDALDIVGIALASTHKEFTVERYRSEYMDMDLSAGDFGQDMGCSLSARPQGSQALLPLFVLLACLLVRSRAAAR